MNTLLEFEGKQVVDFDYFGGLGPKCHFCSLKGTLGVWGSQRGSEAGIQVGLQEASEPWAAEGDSDCKFCQDLGLPYQQVSNCIFWGAGPKMPFLQSESGSESLGAY